MAHKRASIDERGNKLWEGSRMILPEHRQAILEHDRKVQQERPILEEDRLQEISQVLADAIKTKSLITFTIHKPFGNEMVTMYPKRIDPIHKVLKGLDPDGENQVTIPILNIIDAVMR